MSYQGPISVIMGQLKISYENEIIKVIRDAGVNVDKNELLKALQYDRGQYQKGYADRDAEIIRCNECKHSHRTYDGMIKFCDLIKDENDMMIELYRPGDWYCADGERSE